MTDYRKWDAIVADISSDDEEDASAAKASSTPAPAKPSDPTEMIERLTQAELLGEEVLAERQQMVELDRRRNQNREALAALRRMDRQNDGGLRTSQKHWVCMGDVFLRKPQAATKSMLDQEQQRLDNEIEALRKSVKQSATCPLMLEPPPRLSHGRARVRALLSEALTPHTAHAPLIPSQRAANCANSTHLSLGAPSYIAHSSTCMASRPLNSRV